MSEQPEYIHNFLLGVPPLKSQVFIADTEIIGENAINAPS